MKCPYCGAENTEGMKFCGDCGVALPSHSIQYVQLLPMQPLKPRINLVCLVGAVLAVLSLFLPWAVMHDQFTGQKTNLGAFDFDRAFLGIPAFSDNFQLSVTLFVIGAIIAFISPLGGILQLIGALGFVMTTLTWEVADWDMVFWIGAAVATISAALVLLSLVYPMGVGYNQRRSDGLARLLTFSAYR